MNEYVSCYPNVIDQGISIFTYITNRQPQILVSAKVLQSVTCYVLVAQLCLTLVTPWTIALQAPLFLGLPWHEYWSG